MKTAKVTTDNKHFRFASRSACTVIALCLLLVNSGCSRTANATSDVPAWASITATSDSALPPDSSLQETVQSSASSTRKLTVEERFELELSLVPAEQIKFLKSKGWKIELTSEDLAKKYGYSDKICGITVYNDKVIYISAYEYAIRRSTIHEIGHAIAASLGWVEETEEFIEIFEAEKEQFTDCCSIGDGHEISDKYEYFASVYQNMILDYEATKAEVPRTVAYIEDCLSRITVSNEPVPAQTSDNGSMWGHTGWDKNI